VTSLPLSSNPTSLVVLLAPSANQVYAHDAPRLAAAELAIVLGLPVSPVTLAGVDYLELAVAKPVVGSDGSAQLAELLDKVARSSATLAVFQRHLGPDSTVWLQPLALPPLSVDDDLVTIPKYPGKTNPQFTRLLLNVTLSQVDRSLTSKPLTVLDPMCGRGTTLTPAWLLGHDAAGVEIETAAVEAMAAFLKTYLRRKRYKHQATVAPVRREGKVLGKRLDVTASLPAPRPREDGVLRSQESLGVMDSLPASDARGDSDPRSQEGLDFTTAWPTPSPAVGSVAQRSLTVFTGDTRQSAALFGKKRFPAIVVDAPYGVVHGSRSDVRDDRRRDRSAAALLRQAIPVWASQLAVGGALGLSWNSLGWPREEVLDCLAAAGLEPRDGGPWSDLAHRVDSSIRRDVVVAVKAV
jgi:hypothetical protein